MVIFLAVLKIIGIALLAAAGILAVLLLIPVFYEFDLDIDGKCYTARVNWLFRAVRFHFRYRGKAEAVLQVLFFRTDFLDPAKAEARKRRKEKKKAKKLRKERKKRLSGESEAQPARLEDSGGAAEETDKKPEGKERAGGLLQKAKTFAASLRSAHEKQLLNSVWPKLQIFLIRIRPRKLQGEIGFGLDDPASTGQLLGAVAMIPYLYDTDLAICPDFEAEKAYIRGHAYVKGRMQLIHFLILVIKMIADKNVRGFIGSLRKKK